jgi:hypothetical protein
VRCWNASIFCDLRQMCAWYSAATLSAAKT